MNDDALQEALEYVNHVGEDGFIADATAVKRAFGAVVSKLEAFEIEFECIHSWMHSERISDDEWADGYQDAREDVARIVKEAKARFGWRDAKTDPPPFGRAEVYLCLLANWATAGTAVFNGKVWKNGFGESIDVVFWKRLPKVPREDAEVMKNGG